MTIPKYFNPWHLYQESISRGMFCVGVVGVVHLTCKSDSTSFPVVFYVCFFSSLFQLLWHFSSQNSEMHLLFLQWCQQRSCFSCTCSSLGSLCFPFTWQAQYLFYYLLPIILRPFSASHLSKALPPFELHLRIFSPRCIFFHLLFWATFHFFSDTLNFPACFICIIMFLSLWQTLMYDHTHLKSAGKFKQKHKNIFEYIFLLSWI